MSVLRALAGVDARQVRRDPLLRWVVIVPLFIAIAARAVLPQLLARLEARVDLPLSDYYDPIMGVALLLLVPMLVGMVTGFLLLDQRDDRTIAAIQVTPLSLRAYVAFRLAAPMVLSVVMTPLALPLAGVGAPGPLPLLVVALASSWMDRERCCSDSCRPGGRHGSTGRSPARTPGPRGCSRSAA